MKAIQIKTKCPLNIIAVGNHAETLFAIKVSNNVTLKVTSNNCGMAKFFINEEPLSITDLYRVIAKVLGRKGFREDKTLSEYGNTAYVKSGSRAIIYIDKYSPFKQIHTLGNRSVSIDYLASNLCKLEGKVRKLEKIWE